ncbi:MAG: hypothetical protein L6R39_002454 [Caloplaca ligustica]|nr:MAG: hypothetical protein L6R39_002454 [Caloplaca ligustica]
MFGQQDVSAFDTLDHDKHRQRREPWNPYFSKQSVARLQPLLIQTVVDKLCIRLAEHQAAGKPVVMTYAFACVATDVISEYSFPQGYNLLDKPEFDSQHYKAWMALTKMGHILKHFGWLYPLLSSMPMWLTKIISPEMYLMLRLQDDLLQQSVAIAKRRGSPDYKEFNSRPSMMQAFMESNLPESEKSPERIKAEAQTAIGGGTLTSTHALKTATYYILANPDIHTRLLEELENSIPDPDNPPNLRQLEQMPYLVAVLHETLRMFHGTSHRLQRIFPSRTVQYKQHVIPPGNVISMTPMHIDENPNIFPDPYTFDPSRWLGANPPLKYLITFGRGSRACVGMELAKAEILTTLANMFRRFGRKMELWNTDRKRDIDVVYDVFNPMPSKESNGLMVMFKPKRTEGVEDG